MNNEQPAEDSYLPEDIVRHYSVSKEESLRIIEEFGSDKREIDFLLGHRADEEAQVNKQQLAPLSDFLFEI